MKTFFYKVGVPFWFTRVVLVLLITFLVGSAASDIAHAQQMGAYVGQTCTASVLCESGATCNYQKQLAGQGVCLPSGSAAGLTCLVSNSSACGTGFSCVEDTSSLASGYGGCQSTVTGVAGKSGMISNYISPVCGQGNVAIFNASTNSCSCIKMTYTNQTDDLKCDSVSATPPTKTPSTNPTTPPASDNSQVGLYNPLSAGTNLNTLVDDILQLIVKIGSIVIILMLVETGFEYVLARGDAGKLQKLHKRLLFIVIGALILLGAEAIAQGIEATVKALSAGS